MANTLMKSNYWSRQVNYSRSYCLLAFLLLPLHLPADESEESWYCGAGSDAAEVRWISTNLGRQKTVVVEKPQAGRAKTLLVFLHGDSPFSDPVYQYEMVRRISAQQKNSTVAAVLRPGYKDSCGEGSEGESGRKMGDNYTTAVVDSLAAVILGLEKSFEPQRVILIGHSGGAALSALLASRHLQVLDQAILVACPCDVPAWRESMLRLTENPGWNDAMPGLSPLDEISTIEKSTRVSLVVGDADLVTPPDLSVRYLEALLVAGIVADLTVINGGDHDMILRDDILKIVLSKIED